MMAFSDFHSRFVFFVDGHMLREGNFQRQMEYGHRTWFNIESYGEITEEILEVFSHCLRIQDPLIN